MNSNEAIMIIEGEKENEEKIIEAWQHLIDTNIVWQLQGWYGRTAAALIKEGICKTINENKNPETCEACECTPCDCGWGNY